MNIRLALQQEGFDYSTKVGNVYISNDSALANSQLYHFNNIEPHELLAAYSSLFRRFKWTTDVYKELLKNSFAIMAKDVPEGDFLISPARKQGVIKVWLVVRPDFKTCECWLMLANKQTLVTLEPALIKLGETKNDNDSI